MSFDSLHEDWTVWNDEPAGRAILVYRPDVFDGQAFDAECMPTIHVSNTSRQQRPEAKYVRTSTWHATLFLEPSIEGPTETFEGREAAVDGAVRLAARFARGDVDYRSLYQVPREDYFAKLDELTDAPDDAD
jgi:hypothetical protein